MNAHAITRFDTVNPPRAKLQFRRRGLGTTRVGGRRMADPGDHTAGSALPVGDERPISDASSIEEAMALFVAANPAQLYRGGV
jgi:hypothetical protein